MKLTNTIALTVLFLLPIASFAADGKWTCTQGKVTRTIEVTYKEQGKKAPCDVMYTKESAEAKSMWSANNDEGFCIEKAKGFAEKLGGMGWTCE